MIQRLALDPKANGNYSSLPGDQNASEGKRQNASLASLQTACTASCMKWCKCTGNLAPDIPRPSCDAVRMYAQMRPDVEAHKQGSFITVDYDQAMRFRVKPTAPDHRFGWRKLVKTKGGPNARPPK